MSSKQPEEITPLKVSVLMSQTDLYIWNIFDLFSKFQDVENSQLSWSIYCSIPIAGL